MNLLYILERPIQNDLPYELISKVNNINATVLCVEAQKGTLSGNENINQSVFANNLLYKFPYQFLSNFNSLITFIKQADVVVVYGHFHPIFRKAILLSMLLRKKLILTSDAVQLKGASESRGWKLSIKPFIFRLLYNFIANALFVPSRLSRNYFVSIGINKERIVITPYAINEQFIVNNISEKSISEIKCELGIVSTDIIFLFCGKLIPRKRAIDLLKAVSMLSTAQPIKLLIIGEGPEKLQLMRIAETMANNVKVFFIGLVPYNNLFNYYSVADVTVIPADHEPYGLPVNESLFCGTPVIASNQVGAAHDLIEEGKTGFIFPARETNILSEKLNLFVNDKKLKEKMSYQCKLKIKYWSSHTNVGAQLSFFKQKKWIS
jgi:glycosyltransferase involved in cell wall biosynthesis